MRLNTNSVVVSKEFGVQPSRRFLLLFAVSPLRPLLLAARSRQLVCCDPLGLLGCLLVVLGCRFRGFFVSLVLRIFKLGFRSPLVRSFLFWLLIILFRLIGVLPCLFRLGSFLFLAHDNLLGCCPENLVQVLSVLVAIAERSDQILRFLDQTGCSGVFGVG